MGGRKALVKICFALSFGRELSKPEQRALYDQITAALADVFFEWRTLPRDGVHMVCEMETRDTAGISCGAEEEKRKEDVRKNLP